MHHIIEDENFTDDSVDHTHDDSEPVKQTDMQLELKNLAAGAKKKLQ